MCLMNTYIFAYVLEETLHLMVNTFCPHYVLVTLIDIVHHYQYVRCYMPIVKNLVK
jgi:hypothetical protein